MWRRKVNDTPRLCEKFYLRLHSWQNAEYQSITVILTTFFFTKTPFRMSTMRLFSKMVFYIDIAKKSSKKCVYDINLVFIKIDFPQKKTAYNFCKS